MSQLCLTLCLASESIYAASGPSGCESKFTEVSGHIIHQLALGVCC